LLSAMSLQNLPEIADYYLIINGELVWEISDCYQSQFDLKLLKEVQFPAEKISEISDLIIGKGLPNFPIVFCKLVGAAGCVYLEGEIPWPLIFIDISKIKDSNRFREVFIHEAAHLTANDNDHDFKFAAVNTLYRFMDEIPLSSDDYDYRSCDIHGVSIGEAKELASAIASYVLAQRIELSKATDAILELINFKMHIGSDRLSIVDKFIQVLELKN